MILGQAIGPGGQLGPWADEFATGFTSDTSARSQERSQQRAAAKARAEREARTGDKSPAPTNGAPPKKPGRTIKIFGKQIPVLALAGAGVGVAAFFFLGKKKGR